MKRELQAVILAAGKGSRLTELTNFMPKCLLPIGNKPLIHFSLTMLIEAGFKDVIIIVPDSFESEIKSKLSNEYKIHIEYFCIPLNTDLGTADSLRLLNKKLVTDVLLLTCDIVSNYSLKNFINFYRINDPTISILIAKKSSVPTKGNLPGRKSKFMADKDIIGIDAKNKDRLIFLKSEVDFEEFITFKLSNIKLCPNAELSTEYLDTHVYILKKNVVNYLVENQNISSVKSELIPHLIKNQFKRLLNDKNYNPFDSNSNSFTIKADENDKTKSIFHYLTVDDITKKIHALNPLNCEEFYPLINNLKYPKNLLKCSPYIINNENNEYFVARANYLFTYYAINMVSKSLINTNLKSNLGKSICNNCVIGDNTKIHEKTLIKNCLIGFNCHLDEKVRLENCLIMNNVKIEDFCKLKNCIICSNSVIGKKSEINDCIIGFGQNISEASKHSGETIVNADQFMEI